MDVALPNPSVGEQAALAAGLPQVSVIMATYNGARTIRASINSILSQTLRNLEIIVVDDCSTDDTLCVLASIKDARLRVLQNATNSGVVAARNAALAAATAPFVAMLDHDDISLPTRLAKQTAYLQANPDVVLVGTAARTLQDGHTALMNHPRETTPALIHWLLHVANPLVCSSVMFRNQAARAMGFFMRNNFTYADDYDFYHRIAQFGRIARLDEHLTLYRLHPDNAYKKYEHIMAGNAVKVLLPPYEKLFGTQAEAMARLVVNHLSAGKPVASDADFTQLCQVLNRLNIWCLEQTPVHSADYAKTRSLMLAASTQMWNRMVRATAAAGHVSLRHLLHTSPDGIKTNRLNLAMMLANRVPLLARAHRSLRTTAKPRKLPLKSGTLFNIPYHPCAIDSKQPPTLFVVVDTEAEFDWHQPFARELTSVSAMDHIERGQEIFDSYGLRPIYVIDYPIATQERGYKTLRAILQRDGCAIGAHLHPWTTPPLVEEISERNSYPGNLDPALEEQKLAQLISSIQQSFDITPIFYKAGRYGFGPETAKNLVRHGIKIDLSVLPGADLRRFGGPDFSDLLHIPYKIDHTNILTLPMSRAAVGLWPALAPLSARSQATAWGRALHIPSIFARLGLAEIITLTPEGVTAEEQIRLMRTMLAQGCRDFVLHYHSPSLGAGYTPYARDKDGAALILQRLRLVCQYFFGQIGGVPGYPQDLLQRIDEASVDKNAAA